MQSTFLDVTVANGPARVYLDSTTHRPVCAAAPPCKKAVLPGQYKVIAEQSGFERWTGQVTVANGETAKLTVALIEKPSLLTVRVAQPGARIMVDDAAYDVPTTLPGGRPLRPNLGRQCGVQRPWGVPLYQVGSL